MTIGSVKVPDVYSELYPNRFLKADLLKDKPRTLTIEKVNVEVMPTDEGGEKERGIIYFKETKKQLALNRTNGECLKAMFGKKVKDWIGKPITLVPEQAKFGKEDVDAIRISGSPAIDRRIDIEIKMPKRKPQKRTLVPTGKGVVVPTDLDTVAANQPDSVQESEEKPSTDLTPEEIATIMAEEAKENQ